jgi:hypothetical protein
MGEPRRDAASATGTDSPVFVDDSGRRLARARLIVRLCVCMVGAYGVLVAIGLAGSASWPALHLADLGRLQTKSAATPRLGKNSQVAALPVALQPKATPNGPANVSLNDAHGTPGVTAPSGAPALSPGNSSSPGNAQTPRRPVTPGSTTRPTTTPTTQGATTTTSPAPPTTFTTPTTQPMTTTTRAHGSPVSVPHGPPSGRGKTSS